MGNPSVGLAPLLNRGGWNASSALFGDIAEHCNAGRWGQLEIAARAVTDCHPAEALGWLALSRALLKQGAWGAALEALSRVSQLTECDAHMHNDYGYLFYQLDRLAEAEASYRQAIRIAPRFALPYNNLAVLLTDQGRLPEALVHLTRALDIRPEAAESLSNLGCLLRHLGRWADSEAAYRRALELLPDSAPALHGLGVLLDLTGGRDEEAIFFLERCIDLDPGAADACIALGDLLMRRGQADQAVARFRQAQGVRPLITRRAGKEQADFSVLLLDAPGPGCTPITYLAGKAPYDCHFHCIIPGASEDLELLRSKADVVINLITDADSLREMLPAAVQLVELIGRPTLNHPGLIRDTARDSVAKRLAGIPCCRTPKTRRLAGAALLEGAQNGSLDLEGCALPFLVRLAGNHGGDDFEKLAELGEIARFVSRDPEADYYLSEYLDYRSADGLFRKYRFICIDGALLPYHLAIHDDWKVHHFRTDMANQAWMRREEEDFLKDPQLVFDGPRLAALQAVAAATGLGYCGIDCALDRAGEVVVFEANATMLVHEEEDRLFLYKNPYIARIKATFDAMLARLAASRGLAPGRAEAAS